MPAQGRERREETIGGARNWWESVFAEAEVILAAASARQQAPGVGGGSRRSRERLHRDGVLRRTKIDGLEVPRTLAKQLGKLTLVFQDAAGACSWLLLETLRKP